MKDELQAQYDAGRFDMAIGMSSASIAAAESAANYLFQVAKTNKRLTAGDVLALRLHRNRVQRAVETLDEAIALGKPKLILQAAE